MTKKLIGVLKVCLLVFSLLLLNVFSMSAKAEEIFNLEKDGFWAPADSVTHSFSIKNIWNQECYFDYLKFSGSYIKNTATGEEFTLEQAKEMGIIQGYDVVIKLNDSRYGKEVIYNGKLMDLANERVLLKKDIFMKLDTVVDFSINISFEALAGNKYQNMQYIYVFYPHAYKLNPTPTDPSEPDPDKPNPDKPGPDKPNPDRPDTSTPKPNPDTTTPKPDNPDNPSNPDNPNPNNPGGGDNPGGNNNPGGGNNQGGGNNSSGGSNQGGGSNNQGGSNNGGGSSNNGGYQSGGGNTKVPVKTGDQNYYSMTILAIVMVISLEIMFLSTGRSLKEEYRKILRRGDA